MNKSSAIAALDGAGSMVAAVMPHVLSLLPTQPATEAEGEILARDN